MTRNDVGTAAGYGFGLACGAALVWWFGIDKVLMVIVGALICFAAACAVFAFVSVTTRGR